MARLIPHDTSIHLISQGCISSLIASHLHHHQVPFVQRARTPTPLRVAHLTYGVCTLPPARPIDGTDTLSGLVIVPLKAFAIREALQSLQQRIAPESCIALLHNGMGTIDAAKQMFPDVHIIAATTSMAAFKQEDVIKHTGFGNTYFGTVQQGRGDDTIRAKHIAMFHSCFDNAVYLPDIYPALWTKLAVNAVINPLTAIYDFQNGGLSAPSYVKLINQILHEILLVAKAQQVAVDHATVLNTVNTVIYDTRDNYSSMQQDIAHGRRTEIDFINGYIVQEAEKIGLRVPTNKQLWMEVHDLEERL